MLSRCILIGGIYGEKQVYLFPLYLSISNDLVVIIHAYRLFRILKFLVAKIEYYHSYM